MPRLPSAWPASACGVLAQPLSLLVGHVDVVEATEEGGQDDHEDEHEPGRRRDGKTQCRALPWEEGRL